MKGAVARLLTDPAYQERFFGDDPSRHAEHGLSADEFAALRRLDRRKLGITSEGYAGKRFERVESAFPLSLALLEALDPRARGRYLAETAFPPNEEVERATFRAHLAQRRDVGDDARRLLLDLADLEALLYEAPRPGLPSYRYRPEKNRPRVTPHALRLRTRGPLREALALLPAAAPRAYADAPSEWLVLRQGRAVELEPLEESRRALLEACDGARTTVELSSRFGEEAVAVVERWLRFQVVEDASGP